MIRWQCADALGEGAGTPDDLPLLKSRVDAETFSDAQEALRKAIERIQISPAAKRQPASTPAPPR